MPRSADVGTAGVFFISRSSTPTSSPTVVLKAGNYLAPEMFGGLVAQTLGIATPKQRVLDFSRDDEWSNVKNSIFEYIKTKDDIALLLKVTKQLDRPQFLLMEYLPGKDVSHINNELLERLLVLSDASEDGLFSQWNTRLLLRELGQLLALDIFFNNSDRLPTVWVNNGNFFNIFFSSSETGSHVAAIDNSVTPIVDEDLRKSYFATVTEFLTQLSSSPLSLELNYVQRVRDGFLSHFGFDLGDESLRHLQLGIIEGVKLVGERLSDFLLEELKGSVASMIKEDFGGVWKAGMDFIDLSFHSHLLKIFQSCISPFSQILARYPASRNLSPITLMTPDSSTPSEFTVLVVSTPSTSDYSFQAYFDLLERKFASMRKRPDFVIFPEHFMSRPGRVTDPKLTQSLSKLAKQFQVYLVAGSMDETTPEKNLYNSTLTFDRDGQLLGVYRKRFTHSNKYDRGGEVAIYQSEFGPFGVMICLDAEHSVCLNDTFSYTPKPFAIFNPTFIPSSASAMADAKPLNEHWKTSIDMMRRKYEYLMSRHRCYLIRCDYPAPGGMGTTQIIGPDGTSFPPTRFTHSFATTLSLEAPERFFSRRLPTYDRSAIEDSTGHRYLLVSRTKVNKLCCLLPTAVGPISSPHTPTRRPTPPANSLLVEFDQTSGRVDIIDLRRLSSQTHFFLPETVYPDVFAVSCQNSENEYVISFPTDTHVHFYSLEGTEISVSSSRNSEFKEGAARTSLEISVNLSASITPEGNLILFDTATGVTYKQFAAEEPFVNLEADLSMIVAYGSSTTFALEFTMDAIRYSLEDYFQPT